MKKLSFILVLMLLASGALPQESRPCHHAISEEKFRNELEHLKNQQEDMMKLRKARELVSESCVSTAQVKILLDLFKNDNTRLEFAEAAYQNTTDKENFYDVFDCFAHFSNVFRLYDYMGHYQQAPVPQPPAPLPVEQRCVVSAEDFSIVKESIGKQSFENSRITVAKQVISNGKCFTTLQVKEILGLFSFEESKLEIAKYAYEYTSDKRNYFQVNDAFSFANSIEELNKYLNSKR